MAAMTMEGTQSESNNSALREQFFHFGRVQCTPSSPLYARLAESVADSPELLALAAYSPPGQPIANLFFAAVHFLLLSGVKHPLAAFYPGLTPAPAVDADPVPAFADFCRLHRDAIAHLLATRLVQTNEVRRSACLLPAFATVAKEARKQNISPSLALVEVGASAGLNLLWDRYAFDYGDGLTTGNAASSVRIHCERRGARALPALTPLPSVAFRHGIDLNPVNVRDPDATRWLRALIWPEHHDRQTLLRSALAVAASAPPIVTQGNALDVLPNILESVPDDSILCVFHSFTLNQFSPDARARFDTLLTRCSVSRDVYRVAYEGVINGVEITLTLYRNNAKTESRLLAHADPHGKWLEWLA